MIRYMIIWFLSDLAGVAGQNQNIYLLILASIGAFITVVVYPVFKDKPKPPGGVD